MKNKLKIIAITVLSMICLQATVTAFAVELPFVPVEESETDTVTTAVSDNDTPIVTEKQTSTTVTTQKPTTTSTKKPETTRAEEKTTTTKKLVSSTDSASPNETPVVISDSENNDLPVISPDGEVVEELGTTVSAENEPSEVEKSTKTAENSSMPESSDISFSDESDSSEMQTTAHSDSIESSETSEKSTLPIIISVICGAVVIAGAVLFAIFKRGKK
ncbi:MAG: hypothetical protein IJ555_08215 [Ruminococcus sp.]|nr:hypothetical protein [Ruminococcus sp.]